MPNFEFLGRNNGESFATCPISKFFFCVKNWIKSRCRLFLFEKNILFYQKKETLDDILPLCIFSLHPTTLTFLLVFERIIRYMHESYFERMSSF